MWHFSISSVLLFKLLLQNIARSMWGSVCFARPAPLLRKIVESLNWNSSQESKSTTAAFRDYSLPLQEENSPTVKTLPIRSTLNTKFGFRVINNNCNGCKVMDRKLHRNILDSDMDREFFSFGTFSNSFKVNYLRFNGQQLKWKLGT